MELFGRYRLLKKIAVGGMGEIWLARSASIDGFDKDLVIKRILPDLTKDEKFVSLFIAEARISISLSHENVVQVFDFGQTDGSYYIAMEHVSGCDLIEVLSLEDIDLVGIDPGLALYITAQACRGLDYAHNRKDREGKPLNLIHRDISPDNVIVSFDGGVKITDFGISKVAGQVEKKEKGIVGKYPYMSPEHASGKPVDQRSDIFSLAAVLWELLCGRRLYEGELTKSLYAQICAGTVEKPSKYARKIPRALDKLVMRALAADPKDRPQTARDFGQEINDLLRSKYSGSDAYALQAFLQSLKYDLDIPSFEGLEDMAAADPSPQDAFAPADATEPHASPVETVVEPVQIFGVDERVNAVAEQFRQSPSVWHLVNMGYLCAQIGDRASSTSAYRVSAVKFAQHGLLAQALLCAKGMISQDGSAELDAEIANLPRLVGRPDPLVIPYMFRRGGPVEELLSQLVTEKLRKQDAAHSAPPLLSYLGDSSFAQLARLAPMRQFNSEECVVRQGDQGSTMFLILSGRTVVYATNAQGERIYLASMTAGDFFGENSFFTGALRSATVEASETLSVLEIDRALYDKVMAGNPEASDVLLRFYKERIVDSLLATSTVFGLLESKARKALIDKFKLVHVSGGQRLIREGDTTGEIYIVKSGRAVAFTGEGAARVTLSEIGPGTILGEVAAVSRKPRVASVEARDALEVLQLDGSDLQMVLDTAPEVRRRLTALASERLQSIPPGAPA